MWLLILVYKATLPTVITDILRLEKCSKYDAKFTKVHRGKVLTGSILISFVATTTDECVGKCLMLEPCKSINIKRRDQICELNSKDTGDEDARLEKRPGWDMMETFDDERNVS